MIRSYDENVYVDSATRTHIEETGGANIIFVKGNTLVTPKSDTILPSITRRSLVYVAKEYLGMEVEERPVALSELGDFTEAGLCGTAAVISPLGTIVDHGKEINYAGMGSGDCMVVLRRVRLQPIIAKAIRIRGYDSASIFC